MNDKKISRRKLIQGTTALIVGSLITETLSAQAVGKSNQEPGPVYIPSGEGVKGKISRSDIEFKLNKTQTSGHLGSLEMIVPPGQLGAPPHFHKTFDEICIVLQGSIHIMVGDKVQEVKQGDWHLRPRNVVHTFWNSSHANAKLIEMCIPGGHEVYMQELAGLFANGQRPKPGDLQALAGRHDIIFRFDLLESVMKKYNLSL